jgi:transcriptional regulator with XRE-family HTH domain
MGRRRPKPDLLPAKLRRLREDLDFPQEVMATKVRHKRSPVRGGNISEFESGKREPSLFVLLNYCGVAQVSMEALANDDVDVADIYSYDPRSRRLL